MVDAAVVPTQREWDWGAGVGEAEEEIEIASRVKISS